MQKTGRLSSAFTIYDLANSGYTSGICRAADMDILISPVFYIIAGYGTLTRGLQFSCEGTFEYVPPACHAPSSLWY